MAPLPEEHTRNLADQPTMDPVSDDDIVISGVSGLLPNCDSFQEFSERLYNKENMVTKQSGSWDLRHPELMPHVGQIRGVDRFDAQFFTVFYTLAHATEPIARKLFEQTYQAIFDAGICPSELSGRRIGVYASATLCDSEKMCSSSSYVPMGLIGCSRTMFANRISYYLNLKGPSMTMDGDSAGSLVALEKAYHAMMSGDCDAAIVASGKLVLHPQTSILYNRTVPLNSDGKTRCYDSTADGQSLSEAITVMFLQKHKDAKRVYGLLKYAMTEFGTTSERVYEEKMTMPRDVELLSSFYHKFYQQAGIAPSSVEYVEGFGAATPELDKLELLAMDQVFCKDRRDPLLVGSVTSNVGFTDSNTGTCGIFKVILGYQRGQLAANLHCDSPRQDVAAIRDGRMRILTDHEQFHCSYAAVNAFSITGINAHALLKGYRKPKDQSKYNSSIPYLVTASGRQESAVQKILDDVSSRPLDPEEIALLHNIFKTRITKHLSRGFGIYSTQDEKTVNHCQKVDYYDDAKQPLWFVYSGMGSQWVGMGAQLMRIPVFAEAIRRCHKVLEPKGLDLIGIITSKDKYIFDNILHSFVGISAIQIALTDLLKTIGLVPDKIIGHSLGELGCAYADGCFTTEEVMLLSYVRGIVSISIPLERGAMAAVGMGFKQLSKICPPDIDIACHNSSASSTISGPIKVIQEFVERLTAQGVFAKEVQSSNIAYHSRYIAQIGPDFLEMTKDVVKYPKLRSERWISSSVPLERWSEPEAMYSSAEYHTNNLLNTVLFEEVLRYVPSNAVMVEVAPHSLLNAILRRAVPSCRLVPLTRRTHPDNALFCLESIGNLYMAGYDLDISELYPKIDFPVSSPTRPLGHLVEWVHTEKWKVCRYLNPDRAHCSVYKQIVTVQDDEFQYLKGHIIEGTRKIPFAACLVAAWDTLAMTLGQECRKLSVQFQDVKFHCQPPLTDQELINLVATVQRGSGRFEVYDGNAILVEGTITPTSQKSSPSPQSLDKDDSQCLNREDIYKLFYEKGYEYKGQFRSIHSMNASMTQGLIEWRDHWVTFLDALLQTNVLQGKLSWVSPPKIMKRMVIDVKQNLNVRILGGDLLAICYDEIQRRTRCGGVTIEHVSLNPKFPAKRQSSSLHTLKFMPFDQTENSDIITAMHTIMQIISENVITRTITLYFVDNPKRQDYVKKLLRILQTTPEVELNIISIRKEDLLESKPMTKTPDAVFMYDLLSDKKIFEVLYTVLAPNTFIISIGLDSKSVFPSSTYCRVSSIGRGRNKIELAKFKPRAGYSNTTAITIRDTSDMNQLRTTCELLHPQQRLLILASRQAPSDLQDKVKYWRQNCKDVSMVMFDQKNSMEKELENIPNMAVSILHEGSWGGNYYIPTKLKPVPSKGIISLTCIKPGDLSSLNWVEVNEPTKSGIDVAVHYAGLVGYDACRAQGEALTTSADERFGMDFSGVTASGERVMGLIAQGSASNTVKAIPSMLWPVPDHWTMEDAATVPYAYCYALYILTRKCNPAPSQSILIHGGAGALGQALISVSLAYGLEVFVSVSDVRKKHFLMKLFPELKDDHIANSRDGSFKDMVKRGKKLELGCDIVVICAKGKLKSEAVNCCSDFGTMIDTAQLVTGENFSIGMDSLNLKSYATTNFSAIFTEDNYVELKWLQLMMAEGIVKGYIKPLSRVTYAPHETPRAFRLLAASRHRGRVLLSMQASPLILPRISCKSSSSYLVVYKDEDFGVQVTDLLIRRGAKKIYLHANLTPYLKYKIQYWEELEVKVEVSSENLTQKEEVVSLLERSNTLGHLDGVYVVATNKKQQTDTMAGILSYLDLTSREVSPNLGHFAVISENDRDWRQIITERAQNSLPSLSLVLPKLEKFNTSGATHDEAKTTSGSLSMHVALEAVEEALFSGDHIVLAQLQPFTQRSILEEVAKIPGVNITNATVDRTSLEQVGVDHGRALELCNVLRERFHVMLAPEQVPKMTIGQLKRLKREPLDVEKEVSGFGAYISAVDKDEMRATSDVWLMQTLVHRSQMRADEFDLNQDCLCIIPGLEGHHERFRALCERLKVPAVVFQLGHNRLNDSLQEAAQRIADGIMKYLKPKQTFYLLGYEFGVMLCLEIAAILESYGMTGTVYLLGGTPDDIRSSFSARWSHDGDAMQDALLQHIYAIIAQTSSIQFEDTLRKLKHWPDKVEALVETLRQKVSHSGQYIRGITEGIYTRIKLLQGCNIQPHKLQSRIVLIQAKPFKSSTQTLKNLTSQEPVVENLSATLAFAHMDLNTPNIINAYLGRNILDLYNVSNRCETTLINNDEYIKTVGGDDQQPKQC